jgi:hypothetical protein
MHLKQFAEIVLQQYLNNMIQEVIFTKDECERIIKFFSEKQSNVVMPPGQTRVKYKGYLLPNEDGRELIQKLYDWFSLVTNLPLHKFPKENYFMKYEPGDVFSPHTDEYGERVWILGLQLSNESDYEGADFIFHDGNFKINKTIGNAFVTKANLSHEVTKLISGNRFSFVSFPDQSSLVGKKSLF